MTTERFIESRWNSAQLMEHLYELFGLFFTGSGQVTEQIQKKNRQSRLLLAVWPGHRRLRLQLSQVVIAGVITEKTRKTTVLRFLEQMNSIIMIVKLLLRHKKHKTPWTVPITETHRAHHKKDIITAQTFYRCFQGHFLTVNHHPTVGPLLLLDYGHALI